MDKSLQKVIENNLEVNTDGDDYVFTLNKNTNSNFFVICSKLYVTSPTPPNMYCSYRSNIIYPQRLVQYNILFWGNIY